MPKTRLRRCVARGCQRQIPEWLHFCQSDYKLLPAEIKTGLFNEYRYMKRNGLKETERQVELIRQGVEAIEEKQLKKLEKRRARGGDLASPA